ncbi:hypothetical protein AgCh_018032 [Apium graveolens]
MSERKIYGYKSHAAHFILQYLLQFAVIKTLDPEVAIPLIRLGSFFRGICGKVIDLEDVPKLQEEIIEILCQCEIIFPPAFFDIMVHLPIHLCKEVELGGPVLLRWMFGIERYLCKLKSYVRNRSKPEGCIAEGYLVEECLSFCSRFLSDERETKHTEVKENLGYPIGSRRNKDGKAVHLGEKLGNDAHRYILFNCGDMEVEKLIEEYRTLYDTHGKSRKYNREMTHTKEFHNWLKEEIDKKERCSQQLLSLAKGPQRAAKKHTGGICKKIPTAMEADKFPFSVIMEYVMEDCKYTEIGGLYVKKAGGGWKIISNDAEANELVKGLADGAYLDLYIDTVIDKAIEPTKQMQPHVIIRPLTSFFEGQELQLKRKFVTIQGIQQEHAEKKKLVNDSQQLVVEKSGPREEVAVVQ